MALDFLVFRSGTKIIALAMYSLPEKGDFLKRQHL
jgi:hypothetical protein